MNGVETRFFPNLFTFCSTIFATYRAINAMAAVYHTTAKVTIAIDFVAVETFTIPFSKDSSMSDKLSKMDADNLFNSLFCVLLVKS